MPEVIVVGGGPTGLWLAAELRLAGVSVDVLEGRLRRSPHSKAMTLHARTLEVLAMRGLAGQFVNSGGHLLTYHFGMLEQRLPLTGLDSPYPFVLAHSQVQTEEKIERWARDLGAKLLRGHTATGVTQDGDGVTVAVTTPDGEEHTRRAAYVVGCDGSRSVVRQSAGIEFAGHDASAYAFLADGRAGAGTGGGGTARQLSRRTASRGRGGGAPYPGPGRADPGGDARGLELRGLMNRLIAEHPSLVSALVAELTGIDVAYPVPGAHRLIGARVPAPEATLALLSSAKPVLLLDADLPRTRAAAQRLGLTVAPAPSALTARPDWAEVAAVLVRPDGHVWRAVDRSPQADHQMVEALSGLIR